MNAAITLLLLYQVTCRVRNQNYLVLDTVHGYRYYAKKHAPLGEDYHTLDYNTVVIADGLGGYGAETGVGSAEFANKISNHNYEFVREGNIFPELKDRVFFFSEIYEMWQHKNILKYQNSLNQNNNQNNNQNFEKPVFGAATLCMYKLEDNMIKYFNVGDSGFIIFRYDDDQKYFTIYKVSKKFQYKFNTPGFLHVGKDHAVKQIIQKVDQNACTQEDIQILPYDIIIGGSDGLFDNIPDSELEYIIRKNMYNTLEDIYNDIIRFVAENLRNPRFVSPFAKAYNQEYKDTKKPMSGGKPDDLTLVVSQIKDQRVDSFMVKDETDQPLFQQAEQENQRKRNFTVQFQNSYVSKASILSNQKSDYMTVQNFGIMPSIYKDIGEVQMNNKKTAALSVIIPKIIVRQKKKWYSNIGFCTKGQNCNKKLRKSKKNNRK